jgi:hypothetical protein
MLIPGRCHCGNIAWTLLWEPDPVEIPARACTCSFCVKHGGVWTSNPAGHLAVRIALTGLASRYRFGTKTADFHVCTRCGVVPVASCEIDGRRYAVVNVNSLENTDRGLLKHDSAGFDGEGSGDRLARRARYWIPDVRFDPGIGPQ